MRLITLLPAFAAFHLVQALEAPVPGYGVDELYWEVETTPGGPTVILNGTVEDVHAELLNINPTYVEEFAALRARDQPSTEATEATEETTGLHKRWDVQCDGVSLAARGRIQQGIDYLRGLSGQPYLGPGPNTCSRVSCSYNSAIWWCNDNNSGKSLATFNNIADSATVILNVCTSDPYYAGGTEYHADNWRGIVTSANC